MEMSGYNGCLVTGIHALTRPTRLYHIGITSEQDRIVIDNAFLHHMVRNIAGVRIEIGARQKSPEWAEQVLLARDRNLAGVTAAPDGLYLAAIHYPEQFRFARHEIFDVLPKKG